MSPIFTSPFRCRTRLIAATLSVAETNTVLWLNPFDPLKQGSAIRYLFIRLAPLDSLLIPVVPYDKQPKQCHHNQSY